MSTDELLMERIDTIIKALTDIKAILMSRNMKPVIPPVQYNTPPSNDDWDIDKPLETIQKQKEFKVGDDEKYKRLWTMY